MMRKMNISLARQELHNLCQSASHAGTVTVVTIGKTDRAAIVPLSMVEEYQTWLREAQHSGADTIGQAEPRNEPLPAEVTAHSRAADLAAVFEQPPVDDGYSVDDEYEPTDAEIEGSGQ